MEWTLKNDRERFEVLLLTSENVPAWTKKGQHNRFGTRIKAVHLAPDLS